MEQSGDIRKRYLLVVVGLVGIVFGIWLLWVTGIANKITPLSNIFRGLDTQEKKDNSYIELNVRQLDTKYSAQNLVSRYPNNISVKVDENFRDDVEAFGIIDLTIVGPWNWSGYGVVSDNGYKEAFMYTEGGRPGLGENIIIKSMTSSCGECVNSLAAVHFPNARVWLKENSYEVNVPLKEYLYDYKSSKLVTYKSVFPNKEGFYVNGVAYFDENTRGTNPAIPYYLNLETLMTEKHQDLASKLLDLFIDREKLK